MRVIVVGRGLPSKRYPLHGIFEFDQAKALADQGHDVFYVAVDIRSIRRWRKWGRVRFIKEGVKVEVVNIPLVRSSHPIFTKIKQSIFEKTVRKIIKSHGEVDIIHTHFLENGYLAKKFIDSSDIPVVHTEHYSGLLSQPLNPVVKSKGEQVYPDVDQLITVSTHLSESIEENFHVDSVIIPNIVDNGLFTYEKRSKSNHNHFDFISTANLVKSKGMDVLIEAFVHAFSTNESARLFIYGEGPEREHLEQIISQNNMQEQIYLMGLTDREDIAKKMKDSDAFVLASKFETFGLAYIEALAAGLPIISTKCGGPEDFITEENGILVPVNDSIALEKALLKMYKDIDNYNKYEISQAIGHKYSPEKIAQKNLAVYRQVVN